MQQYRKVSSDSLSSLFGDFSKSDPCTCSQSKQRHFQQSFENLPWSPHGPHQRLSRDSWASVLVHCQNDGEDRSRHHSLFKTLQVQVVGVSQIPMTQPECWMLMKVSRSSSSIRWHYSYNLCHRHWMRRLDPYFSGTMRDSCSSSMRHNAKIRGLHFISKALGPRPTCNYAKMWSSCFSYKTRDLRLDEGRT